MQQAARVSDTTAFFLNGEVVEHDDTAVIFTKPRDRQTEDYITRVGSVDKDAGDAKGEMNGYQNYV